MSPDNGHHREEELTAPGRDQPRSAALHPGGGRCGVLGRHARRALRVDFQLAAPPWAMPLAAALRGRSGVATDGLGLDTLAQGGTHYYTESMLRAVGTPDGARELWTRLLGQVMRHATWRTLGRELDDNLKDLARRQFMNEASQFRGHPAEMVLTFYATRTVRGISLTPHAVLGADVATVTPCTDHDVAIACLATHPMEKFHTRIYQALFAKVNATVWGFPRPMTSYPLRRSPASGAGSPPRPSGAMSGCSPADPWNPRSARRSAVISPRARWPRGWPTPRSTAESLPSPSSICGTSAIATGSPAAIHWRSWA